MLETNKLVEIKRGQEGKGLLIEQDGYLFIDKSTLTVNESTDIDNNKWVVPYPFIVSAVFQKYGIENANGRIYPEHILRRQVELYLKKIEDRRAYGECNHPSDSVIDLERISMNIIELHWEGNTLVGKLEIVCSEGFRRFGICSTKGDLIANLLLNKLKIGVSSRGVGSVNQKYGKMIVGDDFELICWDVVSDPSTPGSWIAKNKESLQVYIENTETRDVLFDKIDQIMSIL